MIAQQILLSDDDIDALSRIAQAEASGIASYINSHDPISEDGGAFSAYGSVVNSILNRVACQSWYGNNVQDVINKRTWNDKNLDGIVQNDGYIYQYTPL